MSKTIKQFGYKFVDSANLRGLPVLDCRVIPNPFIRGVSDTFLKNKVREHPLFNTVVKEGLALLETHDTILVGCLFGKHRSGAVAEELSKITGAVITRL